MSFNLRTNSIVSRDGENIVELPYDFSPLPGSKIIVQGNANLGIATVGFLTATNVSSAGVVTATSFIGDGSGLSGLSPYNPSKLIAIKYIISDPPLRS